MSLSIYKYKNILYRIWKSQVIIGTVDANTSVKDKFAYLIYCYEVYLCLRSISLIFSYRLRPIILYIPYSDV